MVPATGAAKSQGMLNRVICGNDILAHAKSLAIKALYIKWKPLSQLKRLTLTRVPGQRRESVEQRPRYAAFGSDDCAVISHRAEHGKAFGPGSVKVIRQRAAASTRPRW